MVSLEAMVIFHLELQLLPEEIKLSIMNPYTCDIDAEIADQIVQTGLFGSAVYG